MIFVLVELAAVLVSILVVNVIGATPVDLDVTALNLTRGAVAG
jgi:hypothetical protein